VLVYAQTTAGINAFAPGSTSNGIEWSQHILIRDFHGSESHGVHASETTPQSLVEIILI
jgi:hypothetical protein